MKAKTKTRVYTQGARAEAAEATGERIVDAFLDRLMTGWYDEITLDEIAREAGVTVMTIARRFGGKEGVLAEAVRRFGEQVNKQRGVPDGNIDRSLDGLIKDYERSGDAVIRLLALEQRHEGIRQVLGFGRSEHRAWVVAAFGGRLAGISQAQRQRAVDMLVVATDVYTWKLLRRDMHYKPADVVSAMKGMIEAAIAAL